ncbi:hypothetical protein RHODOSMS8_01455 [Rhodobiaceae bacterium]|nr:hypothetical protein RHODOSMS8_01455 [Rhodobiaceae bacterium]
MAELKYPEMLEYPWVKEVLAYKPENRSSSELRKTIAPAPVNMVLAIVRDSAARPEVWAAYASAKPNEQIPPRESYLLMMFTEYMRTKYDFVMRREQGRRTNAASTAISVMRDLANDRYSGVEDPQLRADLLKKNSVCEDDWVTYE